MTIKLSQLTDPARLSKFAFVILLAVLTTVILDKKPMNEVIIWFVLSALLIGISISNQESNNFVEIIIGSLLAGLALTLTYSYWCFIAKECHITIPGFSWKVVFTLTFIFPFFCIVGALARLQVFRLLAQFSHDNASMIETRINQSVKIVGAIGFLVTAVINL